MEIRIGIRNTTRELTLESTQSAEEIEKAVADAVSSEDGTLHLADDKGRTVIVPSRALAYVEIAGDGPRRVGFGIGG